MLGARTAAPPPSQPPATYAHPAPPSQVVPGEADSSHPLLGATPTKPMSLTLAAPVVPLQWTDGGEVRPVWLPAGWKAGRHLRILRAASCCPRPARPRPQFSCTCFNPIEALAVAKWAEITPPGELAAAFSGLVRARRTLPVAARRLLLAACNLWH